MGDFRLSKYATFLLKYYFPLHDEVCKEEGRMMKQYATGTASERRRLLKCLNSSAAGFRNTEKNILIFNAAFPEVRV